MANLFRHLVNEEIQICQQLNCVAHDLNLIPKLVSINPLDDAEFAKYIKTNRSSIAFSSISGTGYKKGLPDLLPGDCYQAELRRRIPNSVGYDWVNRNWIGSVLPAGQFVFTYDDGPHVTHTRSIRDTWANAGLAKPTFFWLRNNASTYSSIVKELNSQDYTIGSHSERHSDLGNLAKAQSPADFNLVNKKVYAIEEKSNFQVWKTKTLYREIAQSVIDLSNILGKKVRYFRLPFGSGVKNNLIGNLFQEQNLDHFFWRVDSLDWQDKNPASVQARVVAQMAVVKKGIVLYHDIHPQSAEAAKLMVKFLKNNTTFKAVPLTSIPGLVK